MTTQSIPRSQTILLPDFPAISPVPGAGVINTPSVEDLLLDLPGDRAENLAPLGAGIGFGKAEVTMRSLQVLAQLLESDLGGNDYRAAVQGMAKACETALDEGLAAVRAAAQPYKQTWLEFAAMVELATSHAGPFGLANCSAEQLRADATVRDQLFEQIPKGTRFDQATLVQMLVTPWPGNESTLRAMGTEAVQRRATLLVQFPEMKLEEAQKALAIGGKYSGLRGGEPWQANTVVAGNHLVLQDGTVLSAAPLLAGLLLRNAAVAGSSIAVTPAGYEHPVELSFGGETSLQWQIFDAGVPMAFRDALVPLVNYSADRKVFWGAKSLASNRTGEEFFAVHRTRLYLEKVLADYLNKKAWKVIGPSQAKQCHAALAELLRKVTGDGNEFLLLAGKVLSVKPAPEGPAICDVEMELKFKVPTGLFRVVIRMQPQKSEEGGTDVQASTS